MKTKPNLEKLENYDFSKWSAKDFNLLNRIANNRLNASNRERKLNWIEKNIVDTSGAGLKDTSVGILTALYSKATNNASKTIKINKANLGLVIQDNDVYVPVVSLAGNRQEQFENLKYASIMNSAIFISRGTAKPTLKRVNLLEGASMINSKIIRNYSSLSKTNIAKSASTIKDTIIVDKTKNNIVDVTVGNHVQNGIENSAAFVENKGNVRFAEAFSNATTNITSSSAFIHTEGNLYKVAAFNNIVGDLSSLEAITVATRDVGNSKAFNNIKGDIRDVKAYMDIEGDVTKASAFKDIAGKVHDVHVYKHISGRVENTLAFKDIVGDLSRTEAYNSIKGAVRTVEVYSDIKGDISSALTFLYIRGADCKESKLKLFDGGVHDINMFEYVSGLCSNISALQHVHVTGPVRILKETSGAEIKDLLKDSMALLGYGSLNINYHKNKVDISDNFGFSVVTRMN